MIKGIFFDIDGTLIDEKQCLPASTAAALLKLHEKKIKLIIATGRPKTTLEDMLPLLPIKMDGFVMLNGSYCVAEDKVIRATPLVSEEVREALNFLDLKHINTRISELDDVYINFNDPLKTGREYEHPLYVLKRLDTYPVYQLMADIKASDKDVEEDFFKIMKHARGTRWNDYSMDIVPRESGKEKGLQAVLDHYGIKREEAMAFGDGDNDAGMLEYVGTGVAMGNGRPACQQAADYVTASIHEDGIAKALKHFDVL